jgi:hypothetical protein
MMLLPLYVALALTGGASGAPARQSVAGEVREWASRADSTDAIKRVHLLLHNRYRYGGLRAYQGVSRQMDALQMFCDGARGFICTGGDLDAGPCDVGVMCHLPEGHLVDVLKESVQEYPESGFLNGQAVYALIKFARNVEATAVADACRAEKWFCEALKGYVLDSEGRTREAEPHLSVAMQEAPDSVRCAYTDATWLVGDWDQRNLSLAPPDVRKQVRKWDCARIEAVSDTVWWLSDPLYSVPGNERWAEHVVRSLSARFAAEIRTSSPPEHAPRDYPAYLWARRVRRGEWDSWEHLRSARGYDNSIGTLVWTSDLRAHDHFVPDVELDDLGHPTWSLEAHMEDEGYTPDRGTFDAIPVQLARFRAGDSLMVAGAGSLSGSIVAGEPEHSSRLVLTDGPGSFAASVPGDATRRDTPVFIATAPEGPYIVGLEVVTSGGAAWHRERLEPLPTGAPCLSDLLLYDPAAGEPGSVKVAAGVMLGSTTVAKGSGVGVFWQTYGVPAGATLQFDLSLERPSGGVVEHLGRLLEGRSQQSSGRLKWSEPGAAGTDTRGVVLDLGEVDGGEYTLVLRVSWGEGPPVERRRTITVE